MRNSKGQFIKGYKPTWSEESRRKLSETCKKRGVGKWMLGRKLPEDTKKKISQNSARYWLGKKRGKQSKETIAKRVAKLKGKKNPASKKRFTEDNPCKGKFGKEHPCWKEVKKLPLHEMVRKTFKYRQWHSDVFKRDNWTCQRCGKNGGKLEVHHKKPFREIIKENNIKSEQDALACKELWDKDNGITYCIPCHKKIDFYRK